MTLADVAYFPFLERIDSTLKPFKVGGVFRHGCSICVEGPNGPPDIG